MKPGENLRTAPKRICHAELKRLSNNSSFRVWCPACAEGVLLVARHQETLQLINVDRCTHCAQLVIYTDPFIAGEAVLDITVTH